MGEPVVLVADDDPEMLQLMVRRLSKQGFEIDQAVDGRSALEKLSGRAYDLVVTDIYMPGVTGLELLQQAKEADQHTQVVVVTAGATMENAIEALNNGAFAYLLKPFDHFSVFDTTVSRAMQFRRALLDNERLGEIQRRRGDMLEEEVTERVQQLQRRRKELMELLASLPDGVMVVEGTGRIMMTNPIADTWMAHDRQDPGRPIQTYLETLHEDWAAEEWEVELVGEKLSLVTSTLAGSDGLRKVVVIRSRPVAREAIGPEEAIKLLEEASHWLQVHPLQRAMQSSLKQLDELISDLRGKIQERPSTDELRRIEWSELDLNAKPVEGQPKPDPSQTMKHDALVEEDLDPGRAGTR